jgi:hypothetical protein
MKNLNRSRVRGNEYHQLLSFLALLLLCAVALNSPAEQTHDFGITSPMGTNWTFTQSSTVTNTVGTNTVISLAISNPVAHLGLWKNADLLLGFTPVAGADVKTNVVTATFARTFDGVLVETTPRFTVTAFANTNLTVAVFSNITAYIEGGPDLSLVSLVNSPGAAVLTNITVKLRGQRISP